MTNVINRNSDIAVISRAGGKYSIRFNDGETAVAASSAEVDVLCEAKRVASNETSINNEENAMTNLEIGMVYDSTLLSSDELAALKSDETVAFIDEYYTLSNGAEEAFAKYADTLNGMADSLREEAKRKTALANKLRKRTPKSVAAGPLAKLRKIYAEMLESGEEITRKAFLIAAINAGLNPATASTQYGVIKKEHAS